VVVQPRVAKVTAVLGSVIAGLLPSYQWGRAAEERSVTAIPASPEMMQLLRDEHGLIADMLKVQIAKGKW
jgi:hypothetical protein